MMVDSQDFLCGDLETLKDCSNIDPLAPYRQSVGNKLNHDSVQQNLLVTHEYARVRVLSRTLTCVDHESTNELMNFNLILRTS